MFANVETKVIEIPAEEGGVRSTVTTNLWSRLAEGEEPMIRVLIDKLKTLAPIDVSVNRAKSRVLKQVEFGAHGDEALALARTLKQIGEGFNVD